MSPILLSDAHAHLDHFPAGELPGVLERARVVGVAMIVAAGMDLESSRRAVEMAAANDIVYAAVGIHPMFVREPVGEDAYARLRELALSHPKVVAISETGLDADHGQAPLSIQEQAFRQQLRLARDLRLPVILHDRRGTSHADIVRILREERAYEVGGASHYFQGTERMAREYVDDLGFHLSFGKVVARDEGAFLHRIVRSVPLESILTETDASPRPEQTAADWTEPAHVGLVAAAIARWRGMETAAMALLATRNLRRMLRLETRQGQESSRR